MPSLLTIVASIGLFGASLLLLFNAYEGRLQPYYPRPVRTPQTNFANMTTGQQKGKWSDDIDIVCDDQERFDRLRYGPGPGASVVGYPAKGGLYVLDKASSVEVEFLGFGRFDTEARSDSDTEEALCDNMRRLGAVWWKTQRDYIISLIEVSPSPKDPKKNIIVGWPAGGGIWVYDATEPHDKDAGIVHNAHSMEERCKVIEKLGGKFYKNPKDCPDLDLP